jgi:hypothetical protein
VQPQDLDTRSDAGAGPLCILRQAEEPPPAMLRPSAGSEDVQNDLAQADADLYLHLTVTPGGLCVTCAQAEPCPAREEAHAMFSRHGALPRRRPGIAGVWMEDAGQAFDGFAAAHRRRNDSM